MQQDFWKILVVENDPLYMESISRDFSRDNFIIYPHLDFSKEKIAGLLAEGSFDLVLVNLSCLDDELFDLLVSYEAPLVPYYVLGSIGKYPLGRGLILQSKGIDIKEISGSSNGSSRFVLGHPGASFEEVIDTAKASLTKEAQEIYV